MKRSILFIIWVILSGIVAEGNDFSNFSGMFVSSGVTLSKFGKDPYSGVEISSFSTNTYCYAGAFAEGGYVPRTDTYRVVAGPEFGFLILGIDGGYMMLKKRDQRMNGFSVRPYITIPLPGLFVERGLMFNIFYRRNAWKKSKMWLYENETGIQVKYAFLASN